VTAATRIIQPAAGRLEVPDEADCTDVAAHALLDPAPRGR
jgi:hypothetical protein